MRPHRARMSDSMLETLGLYPRDVRKRSICYGNVAGWQAGWLAVCLSHAGIVSPRLKPILKLFRPPGSPIILVSSDPCADTQFQAEPLQLNTRGGKNWRFSTEIAVYLGNGAR